MSRPSITIINDANMRGVIAPSSTISREMLEDFVDFFELSTPEEVAREDRLIKEADRDNSWVPFEAPKKRARKAR